MNKIGIEEGIIKVIDGEMYYKSHYCYWLYTQLEEMQNRIDKAIEYLKDNACYENTISELFCDDLDNDSCMELLDILRGNDE